MRADVKAQWVAALRSGEYRQGRGVLHNVDDNTYCCLGVLCDLAVKAGVVQDVTTGDSTVTGGTAEEYAGCMSLPPDVVAEWAGLPERSPAVVDPAGVSEGEVGITELNDSFRYSFSRLATLIEDSL